MSIFVRISAVLVGVCNTIMYGVAADTVVGEPQKPQTFSWDLEPRPVTALYALAAGVAGLLVSELYLGLTRKGIRATSTPAILRWC
jgi:hypothetical protein